MFPQLRTHKILPFIAFFILGLSLIFTTVVFVSKNNQPKPFFSHASNIATFYVSKNGNNKDGTSWTNAWNELNQINWSEIEPGDTIAIDGGNSSMTYDTTLTVGASGTSGNPIIIERSTAAGHNGSINFFGGRSTLLPYCGQSSYTYQSNGVLSQGINIGNNSYITINGESWHGISIYGVNGSAIVFGSSASNITIQDMYLYDDGTASQGSSGWTPFGPFLVDLHGNNDIFTYMDMDAGGEDAFQPTNINNVTISYSWLHDSRSNPNYPGSSFNQCNHNDGMQIWTGNTDANLTFDYDVIGPTKENGLIIGNGIVTVNNVTIENTLIIDADANNVWGATADNWTIDHITSFAQNQNLILEGSGNSVTNSIFYGGLMSEHSSVTSSNDCQWQTTGDTLNGQNADPEFTSDVSGFQQGISSDLRSAPTASTLQALDFSLRPTSSCKGLGSSITSVAEFLSIVSNEPTNTPTATSTTTPVATPTVTPTATKAPTAMPTTTKAPTSTPTKVVTPTSTITTTNTTTPKQTITVTQSPITKATITSSPITPPPSGQIQISDQNNQPVSNATVTFNTTTGSVTEKTNTNGIVKTPSNTSSISSIATNNKQISLNTKVNANTGYAVDINESNGSISDILAYTNNTITKTIILVIAFLLIFATIVFVLRKKILAKYKTTWGHSLA